MILAIFRYQILLKNKKNKAPGINPKGFVFINILGDPTINISQFFHPYHFK